MTAEGHTEIVDTGSSGGDGTVTPPAVTYYVYCASSLSHQGAWTGQDWPVAADAQRECDDHNTWCDSHGASVHSRP